MFISLVFGVMYLGPTYATMQRLVGARERAVGSALLLLIVNLVGLGLGPWLVGVVSDVINNLFLADGAADGGCEGAGPALGARHHGVHQRVVIRALHARGEDAGAR